MMAMDLSERYRDVLRIGIKELPLELADSTRRLLRGQPRLRVFSLNSGSCGSGYIVELLRANGVRRCYHEKWPDWDVEGVEYFLDGKRERELTWLLKHTRRLVEFESNNRLFAFAKLLKRAFPEARFIHQHRDPRADLISGMNKDDWPGVMSNRKRLRYASHLSGPQSESALERSCHYWANINKRILDDLQALGESFLSLKFADLIAGRVEHLEQFLGIALNIRQIAPVNIKQHLKASERPRVTFETLQDWERGRFDDICGETMSRLGYQYGDGYV